MFHCWRCPVDSIPRAHLPSGVVAIGLRSTISAVTALSVLLCHVVCACGGSFSHADGRAVGHGAVPPKSHCHAHHDDQDAGHGSPAPAHCPDKGHDHSCPHCKQAGAVKIGVDKGATDLKPVGSFIGFLDSSILALAGSRSAFRVGHFACGASPPLPSTSLLSLHCALNT